MALARHATVAAAELLGPGTRLLTLELPAGEPLGFTGGQYIIVDTGLQTEAGKAVKRAYSILSADEEQHRFTLASKRLAGAAGAGATNASATAWAGSEHMHTRQIGDAVKFSGPWGKLRPAEGLPGRTLVLATDTGVTAALGLVLGRLFAPLLPHTRFVWLRTEAAYFLPEAFVRGRLPAALGQVDIGYLPPIAHPERLPHVRATLGSDLRAGLAQAFIAGDGTVNYALLEDLRTAGVPATRDSVESFFNMPKKTEAA